jgi:hypothetical protein
MASIISAGTTSGTALNMTGDTSGVLQLATNGSTTAITIDTSQRAAFVAGTAAAPAITTSGDTNTGIFFPAADTIAFAEGGTEAMRLTDTGLLQFNSGYGSVATAYGCRAWVNFNGTGTVAIRASGNVSSITDNGVGNYTVNFTTAMSDANYNLVTAATQDFWSTAGGVTAGQTTTTAILRVSGETAYRDVAVISVAVFR